MRGGVSVKGKEKGRSNTKKTWLHFCWTFLWVSFFCEKQMKSKIRQEATQAWEPAIFSFGLGRLPRLSFLLSFSHQWLELFASPHRLGIDADASDLRGSWGIITLRGKKRQKNEKRKFLLIRFSGRRKLKEKDTALCETGFLFPVSSPDNLLSTCQIYLLSLWEGPDPPWLQGKSPVTYKIFFIMARPALMTSRSRRWWRPGQILIWVTSTFLEVTQMIKRHWSVTLLRPKTHKHLACGHQSALLGVACNETPVTCINHQSDVLCVGSRSTPR